MDGIKENPEIADKLSLVLRGEKTSDEILGKEKTTDTDADAEKSQGEMAQVSELPAQSEVELPTESEANKDRRRRFSFTGNGTNVISHPERRSLSFTMNLLKSNFLALSVGGDGSLH